MLKALRGLGLSEDLIGQVAKSLQPPVGNRVSSRERMAHLKEQLHHLQVRITRQVEVLRVHTEQCELMVSKLNACHDEEASMDAQYRELGAKKLTHTPSSSPARSPAVSVVDHDDLQWANQRDDADVVVEQDAGFGRWPQSTWPT